MNRGRIAFIAALAGGIAAMNAMYKLPAHERPVLPADVADRLVKFKATLMDEVHWRRGW